MNKDKNNKNNKKNKKQKHLPFVSVCTPTFNRRPFIENMFKMFKNQTYPKNRMEWIILDDGTDKIKDLIEKSGIGIDMIIRSFLNAIALQLVEF